MNTNIKRIFLVDIVLTNSKNIHTITPRSAPLDPVIITTAMEAKRTIIKKIRCTKYLFPSVIFLHNIPTERIKKPANSLGSVAVPRITKDFLPVYPNIIVLPIKKRITNIIVSTIKIISITFIDILVKRAHINTILMPKRRITENIF